METIATAVSCSSDVPWLGEVGLVSESTGKPHRAWGWCMGGGGCDVDDVVIGGGIACTNTMHGAACPLTQTILNSLSIKY